MNLLTKCLAFVCAVCPVCVVVRRFPGSGFARFWGKIENHCPFCRAYDRIKKPT